jgi:hypothetical protein
VLLPPAPPLSRSHYDLALNAFAVRNVAKYAEPVVPRDPSERHDWEILSELAGRVLAPRGLRRLAVRAARAMRPDRLLDLMLRAGPYRLSLARLREAPHGLDLGPLQPGRIIRLVATPDKKVDLAPEDFTNEARARLFAESDKDLGDDLVLIGRRQLQSNNSWMHNARRLMKNPTRFTLLLHPSDASARHLTTGDLARLQTTAGTIVVPVEVSDAMLPGVVSLPHGWGHDRPGTHLAVASEHAGASLNDVTADDRLDTLSGNAAFNGVLVSLAPV